MRVVSVSSLPRHQSTRRRPGDVPGQPAYGTDFLSRSLGGRSRRARPSIFFCGVVGLVAATLAGFWSRVEEATLEQDCAGTTACWSDLALATFLAPGPALDLRAPRWGCVDDRQICGRRTRSGPSARSTLTFPFVLVTWILLLATAGFAGLSSAPCASAAILRRSKRAEHGGAGLCRGRSSVNFAGVPEGERILGAVAVARSCGEFAAGGRFCPWRRPFSRCLSRMCSAPRATSSREACWVQPGADGGRARRRFP